MDNTIENALAYRRNAPLGETVGETMVRFAADVAYASSIRPASEVVVRVPSEMEPDYKQIAFKLQGDIDMRAWENAQKNIPFLEEMKSRIKRFQNGDSTEIEMVHTMIDDWIDELKTIE